MGRRRLGTTGQVRPGARAFCDCHVRGRNVNVVIAELRGPEGPVSEAPYL